MRTSSRRRSVGAQVTRLARVLLVDAALLVALIIATSISLKAASGFVQEQLGSGEPLARYGIVAVAGLVSVPLCAGVLSNARRLGETLATAALPDRPQGRPDLADAPRRALVAIFQLATVILVALIVIAVTQPFVPGVPGAVVLLVVVGVLGLAFWRSATQLQGHLRAGAQVIVEALAKGAGSHEHAEVDALAEMRALLPGLGEPVAMRLNERSPAIGRTLASLNLRGLTGATVLAISRPGGGVMVPSAHETLRAGDVLALAGTKESVEAARVLLEPPAPVDLVRQA